MQHGHVFIVSSIIFLFLLPILPIEVLSSTGLLGQASTYVEFSTLPPNFDVKFDSKLFDSMHCVCASWLDTDVAAGTLHNV